MIKKKEENGNLLTEENIGINYLINELSGSKYVRMSAADFDVLLKLIDIFKENSNILSIKNSKIIQTIKGTVNLVNLSSFFPEDFTFYIVNPKKYYLNMKFLRKNTDVIIFDVGPKYIASNGELKIYLPKPNDNTLYSSMAEFPQFEESCELCKTRIDKEFAQMIRDLAKNSSYITLLIKNNKIKSISVPNIAIRVLDEYKNNSDALGLTDETADLCLRSIGLFQIPSETYEIWLMKKNESYFLVTRQIVGGIDVFSSEELEVNSFENFII